VLKQLTATGIVAAAAAGFIVLGGTANADSLSVTPTSHAVTSYHPGDHGYRGGRWHNRDRWNRWNRWHHRYGYGHRYHFHH
jgi:hypothetical protein